MRSTSIFLLITSVLTFSAASFTASAEDSAMHHHHHMSARVDMNKQGDSTALYSASGVIKAWRDNAVVIAHSPVAQLNWPPMTMSFALGDNQDKKLAVGQQVNFTFRQTDSGYALVSITAQ